MITDYNTFFNIKMPGQGYHCPNGIDELHHEKNLSFSCSCGKDHSVKDSMAYINFPIENKTLYKCPLNKYIFVLVRPTGFFKIKGLKTIATYIAQNDQEYEHVIIEIERRKKTY